MRDIDRQLQDYYNKSFAYTELMRSHTGNYFASYLTLIGNYTQGADRLLEVGCGSGASTHAIASKFPFLDCTGIDISPEAIEFASRKYHLKNLHFEMGDAKSLDYPDNSFSIVTSFDCLEHIPDLEAVLHELMRVVKPGGYLIIKGPNHMSPLYTLVDIMSFRHRYPFTRFWLDNFPRLAFELSHLALGLAGRVKFIPRLPDLSDSIQVGNDADAVTDMCNLDVCNFLKRANWKILNVSWPRGSNKSGMVISKQLPLLGSMGIVAKKPLMGLEISQHDIRNSSVMVFAPHPDDETIGAGGVIIQTVKKGGNVKVIYLTTGISSANEKSEQILLREKEPISAMKLAGVNEDKLIFLRHNSGDLSKISIFNECIKKISQIISADVPDYIFIPAYEGGHIDHDMTNFILYKTLTALKLNRIQIFEYAEYTSYLKIDINTMKRVLRRFCKYVPFVNFRFPHIFIPHNRLSHIPSFQLKMSAEELNLKLEMLKQYSSQNPTELIFWHGFPDRVRIFFPHDYTKLPYNRGALEKIVYFIGEKLKKSNIEYRIIKKPPALYFENDTSN
jgi:LmbE family N-acetylglucosaminyl deacetylase/SAM-dependent methyltransferase